MTGIDLVYEWAVSVGYFAHKCDVSGSHICEISKPVEYKFHLPVVSIYPGVRIYLDASRVRMYVRTRPGTPPFVRPVLDIHNPNFFSELERVIEFYLENIKV